jgi:heme/copper-type cytochrome/quinol oxidase subunit 2
MMTMAVVLVVLTLLVFFAWSHQQQKLEPQPPLHAREVMHESPRTEFTSEAQYQRE